MGAPARAAAGLCGRIGRTGIHLDYRGLAEEVQVADEVKLHKYAAHLLNSQVFALNLFLPFREGDRKALSERGCWWTRWALSGCHPGRCLASWRGIVPVRTSPPRPLTSSRLEDGRRAVVLVEAKLSEDRFTTCNGRIGRGNRRKDVCESAPLFFSDPNTCYLRRPKRKRRDRRYWKIFAARHGCVRDAFPGADIAWLVLCAHDGNPDVPGHWKERAESLPDPAMAPSLPASAVTDGGRDPRGLAGSQSLSEHAPPQGAPPRTAAAGRDLPRG